MGKVFLPCIIACFIIFYAAHKPIHKIKIIKPDHHPNDTIYVMSQDGLNMYVNTDSTHYTVIPTFK